MKTPQLLPGMKMARFGKRPNGEPLYRVVFSDSVTYLVGARWPDGVAEYREMPLYDGHSWTLEKWQSAFEFCGTKEAYHRQQYDPASGLLTLGPYPDDGVWQFVYSFPCEPNFTMISGVIRGVTATKNLTPQQSREGILAPMLARRKAQHQQIDDVFDESQNAFKRASAVIGPGARPIHSTKNRRVDDVRFKRSAEELGLPMSDNAFFAGEDTHGNRSGDTR